MAEMLLTTDQAADILKLKPVTLKKWRVVGTGPPYIRLGGAIRYRQSDLLEYVERATITPRF